MILIFVVFDHVKKRLPFYMFCFLLHDYKFKLLIEMMTAIGVGKSMLLKTPCLNVF